MENDEDQRTVWCGNLSDKVTEELLYELFLQAAPLQRVKIPKDREGRQNSYGFITLKHVFSVPYVIQLLNGTSLFDRRINLKPRNSNQNQNKVEYYVLHAPAAENNSNQMGARTIINENVREESYAVKQRQAHMTGGRWERNSYRQENHWDDSKPCRQTNNYNQFSGRNNNNNRVNPYRNNNFDRNRKNRHR